MTITTLGRASFSFGLSLHRWLRCESAVNFLAGSERIWHHYASPFEFFSIFALLCSSWFLISLFNFSLVRTNFSLREVLDKEDFRRENSIITTENFSLSHLGNDEFLNPTSISMSRDSRSPKQTSILIKKVLFNSILPFSTFYWTFLKIH